MDDKHDSIAGAEQFSGFNYIPPPCETRAVTFTPTYWLTFGSSGIAINCATGEVTIPEGLELTDAARAFWDEVRRIGGPPGFVA
jgi:hypothetical protein